MKYILVDNSQEQGHQDVKPEREWLIQPELFSFLIKAVPGVGDWNSHEMSEPKLQAQTLLSKISWKKILKEK